jgi:hypothetical protein
MSSLLAGNNSYGLASTTTAVGWRIQGNRRQDRSRRAQRILLTSRRRPARAGRDDRIVRAEFPLMPSPWHRRRPAVSGARHLFAFSNRSVTQGLHLTPHTVKAVLQQRVRQTRDQFARRAEHADGQQRPPHHIDSGDLAITPLGLKDCPPGNSVTHARAAMLVVVSQPGSHPSGGRGQAKPPRRRAHEKGRNHAQSQRTESWRCCPWCSAVAGS